MAAAPMPGLEEDDVEQEQGLTSSGKAMPPLDRRLTSVQILLDCRLVLCLRSKLLLLLHAPSVGIQI